MTRWGIDVRGPELSFDAIFGRRDRVVLDIGFGSGEALIELAETRRDEHVIGVDVHTPGVAAVLEAIEARALQNVRVAEGDVLDLAERMPPHSLATIRVFFPDPWPKRRQRVRRLIRGDVIDRLAPLLQPGGTLHVATDDTDYAEQIERVCNAHPSLKGGVIERPAWRPVTRYEQRALDEGRRSLDLIYTSSDNAESASSSAPR